MIEATKFCIMISKQSTKRLFDSSNHGPLLARERAALCNSRSSIDAIHFTVPLERYRSDVVTRDAIMSCNACAEVSRLPAEEKRHHVKVRKREKIEQALTTPILYSIPTSVALGDPQGTSP